MYGKLIPRYAFLLQVSGIFAWKILSTTCWAENGLWLGVDKNYKSQTMMKYFFGQSLSPNSVKIECDCKCVSVRLIKINAKILQF